MYAIVWSETRRAGVVASRMEGKRLAAMTVLTVLPSVCAHCGHPLSSLRQNSVRKLKQDLQNTWQPRQSFRKDNTPLKPSAHSLADNTDSGFCSPSRSVYAVPRFTKHHWHQITFGASGPKLILPHSPIFKICRGCTKCRSNFWPGLG